MRYAQTAAASFEPLTLAELKLHLRVDDDDENTLITSLQTAARTYVEARTNHILCTRAFYLEASAFPTQGGPIVFPIGPVTAVSALQYVDSATNTAITMSSSGYRLQSNLLPSRLRLALGTIEWPEAAVIDDAVRVTATVGYANQAAVPEQAKHAIRLLAGHWFENREGVVNGTISTDVKIAVEALLRSLWLAEVAT
jgi:uncharacterized phiE125 gp8 family phage protein